MPRVSRSQDWNCRSRSRPWNSSRNVTRCEVSSASYLRQRGVERVTKGGLRKKRGNRRMSSTVGDSLRFFENGLATGVRVRK